MCISKRNIYIYIILFGFCNILDNVMMSHDADLTCMNFPKKIMSEHNLQKVTRQIG